MKHLTGVHTPGNVHHMNQNVTISGNLTITCSECGVLRAGSDVRNLTHAQMLAEAHSESHRKVGA